MTARPAARSHDISPRKAAELKTQLNIATAAMNVLREKTEDIESVFSFRCWKVVEMIAAFYVTLPAESIVGQERIVHEEEFDQLTYGLDDDED